MPSGVLQRSQRLAIGQDNRPIEALIPGHDATTPQLEPGINVGEEFSFRVGCCDLMPPDWSSPHGLSGVVTRPVGSPDEDR